MPSPTASRLTRNLEVDLELGIELGKVAKSNSHCDYVVELHDRHSRNAPPQPEDYGFGSFVKFETPQRHWAVGLIYNTQLLNPAFMNLGPKLSSEADPMFTPDLIVETRTLLNVVLVGTLERATVGSKPQGAIAQTYGIQGIPKAVVPVETPVWTMDAAEIYGFHLDAAQHPQFRYYGHVLKAGGPFATQLIEQVLGELIEHSSFDATGVRSLTLLRKELSWKNTMAAMR